MEQFLKDLQAICLQYGHKVDTINPTIDADGKILDITIFMGDDSQDIFIGDFPKYFGERGN